MPKECNIAVDVLKFLAVFLIINSHADVMYPRLSALATGGAIGDCLFLFVSGFTLFLSAPRSFDNYYKRRIQRIFPSVIAALIFIRLMEPSRILSPVEFAGGEFIVALMLYYGLLYLVRRYLLRHIPAVIAVVAAVTLLVYIFAFPYKYETGERGLYGITSLFRWLPFFVFMLCGAWLGLRKQQGLDRHRPRPWLDFALMVGSAILFYAIQFAAKLCPVVAPAQILSLIPLMGVVYYMYRWCEAPFFARLYQCPGWHWAITFVSGLCLESYLIQYSIITPRLNAIWPLNLLLIVVAILACSYAVRCLSRIITQTFSPADYDWPAIFRP